MALLQTFLVVVVVVCVCVCVYPLFYSSERERESEREFARARNIGFLSGSMEGRIRVNVWIIGVAFSEAFDARLYKCASLRYCDSERVEIFFLIFADESLIMLWKSAGMSRIAFRINRAGIRTMRLRYRCVLPQAAIILEA